jgi:hypothetical protein
LLRISEIRLVQNGLIGRIPTEMSFINSLTLLDLSFNSDITGVIPEQLYRARRLRKSMFAIRRGAKSLERYTDLFFLSIGILSDTLDLSFTAVTGSIHSEIGSLSRLGTPLLLPIMKVLLLLLLQLCFLLSTLSLLHDYRSTDTVKYVLDGYATDRAWFIRKFE